MSLLLTPLPYEKIPGIYGARKDRFPQRMAFLHPVAAESFLAMQEALGWRVRCSDIWRASTASLGRKFPPGRRARRGTARPAYSAHNYGLAIDIDTDSTMRALDVGKPELDRLLEPLGWYCHRRDRARGSEDWHYNCLVLGGGVREWMVHASLKSTARAVEAEIQSLYSEMWKLTDLEIQEHLVFLRYYDGDIDGIIGDHTREAVRAFQRAWHLRVDGVPGPMTMRTLAFRVAELHCDAVKDLRNVRRA